MADAVTRPALVLAATVIASAMAFIDGTVVTIALPALQTELQTDFQQLQWVVNAYTLPLGALILVGGGIGDRIGRKRVFVAGIATFARRLINLRAGLERRAVDCRPRTARDRRGVPGPSESSHHLGKLSSRGSRAGNRGLGGGIRDHDGAGAAVGGFLIDTLSWRVAFWINLPFSAAALWLTFRYVPESRDENATGALDWAGSALAALALGALTFGLTSLSDGTPRTGTVLASLLIGAIGAGGRSGGWRSGPPIRSCPSSCSGRGPSWWPTSPPCSCMGHWAPSCFSSRFD
jgi:MFS family permease